MKNNFRLFVFMLLFCLCIPRANAEQDLSFLDPNITISMDFKDASIKDILKILSIQSGLNFIASEALLDRKMTLYLDKVPINEAMDKIFEANNLSYEMDEAANIFIVKEWGKPEVETITKIYNIKHRSLPSSKIEKEKSNLFLSASGATGSTGTAGADIVSALRQVLSLNGKITEDIGTNSLIVTDIPSSFVDIENLIKALDVPQLQVMLDVEILDVSKDVVDKLGFEFSQNNLTLLLPGGFLRRGAEFFIGDITKRGHTISSTSDAAGLVGLGRSYTEVLDFLRTQTDTKYLARPRLLTLNNETAEISITKDEIVGKDPIMGTSTTGAVTITGYNYIRSTSLDLTKEGTGIFLRVTPQINLETNEITMVVNPKSSTTTTSSIGGSDQADAEVRSTKSIVKVRNGETVILGGLIHQDKSVAIKKLPILGDLPFIGLLFRHKNQTKDKERELLVFITPHIVKDASTGSAYARKTVLPEREQSASSSLARQLAINTTLNSFDKIK